MDDADVKMTMDQTMADSQQRADSSEPATTQATATSTSAVAAATQAVAAATQAMAAANLATANTFQATAKPAQPKTPTQPQASKRLRLREIKDDGEVEESESQSSASGRPKFKLEPQYPGFKSLIGQFDEKDALAMARGQSSAASRDIKKGNTVTSVGDDKGRIQLRRSQPLEVASEKMTGMLKDKTQVSEGESGGVIVDDNDGTPVYLLNPHTNQVLEIIRSTGKATEIRLQDHSCFHKSLYEMRQGCVQAAFSSPLTDAEFRSMDGIAAHKLFPTLITKELDVRQQTSRTLTRDSHGNFVSSTDPTAMSFASKPIDEATALRQKLAHYKSMRQGVERAIARIEKVQREIDEPEPPSKKLKAKSKAKPVVDSLEDLHNDWRGPFAECIKDTQSAGERNAFVDATQELLMGIAEFYRAGMTGSVIYGQRMLKEIELKTGRLLDLMTVVQTQVKSYSKFELNPWVVSEMTPGFHVCQCDQCQVTATKALENSLYLKTLREMQRNLTERTDDSALEPERQPSRVMESDMTGEWTRGKFLDLKQQFLECVDGLKQRHDVHIYNELGAVRYWQDVLLTQEQHNGVYSLIPDSWNEDVKDLPLDARFMSRAADSGAQNNLVNIRTEDGSLTAMGRDLVYIATKLINESEMTMSEELLDVTVGDIQRRFLGDGDFMRVLEGYGHSKRMTFMLDQQTTATEDDLILTDIKATADETDTDHASSEATAKARFSYQCCGIGFEHRSHFLAHQSANPDFHMSDQEEAHWFDWLRQNSLPAPEVEVSYKADERLYLRKFLAVTSTFPRDTDYNGPRPIEYCAESINEWEEDERFAVIAITFNIDFFLRNTPIQPQGVDPRSHKSIKPPEGEIPELEWKKLAKNKARLKLVDYKWQRWWLEYMVKSENTAIQTSWTVPTEWTKEETQMHEERQKVRARREDNMQSTDESAFRRMIRYPTQQFTKDGEYVSEFVEREEGGLESYTGLRFDGDWNLLDKQGAILAPWHRVDDYLRSKIGDERHEPSITPAFVEDLAYVRSRIVNSGLGHLEQEIEYWTRLLEIEQTYLRWIKLPKDDRLYKAAMREGYGFDYVVRRSEIEIKELSRDLKWYNTLLPHYTKVAEIMDKFAGVTN